MQPLPCSPLPQRAMARVCGWEVEAAVAAMVTALGVPLSPALSSQWLLFIVISYATGCPPLFASKSATTAPRPAPFHRNPQTSAGLRAYSLGCIFASDSHRPERLRRQVHRRTTPHQLASSRAHSCACRGTPTPGRLNRRRLCLEQARHA
ncbi:hypothetical protein GUJ93_ZPchr0001g30697 [Zizania palustris]|uniref:Uncharacterized protein n=1 Tax=Zizania palustris TaxID=103762 RepID=A0A8J5S5N6_ZIZPA|nr:hypothetical protein GUJ93_ZPchr0001g30697 [Zizania palustris]